MYGQGKGISKSSMPYKKVPPRWLPIDSKEVTNLIESLAKKGFKPSKIGIILRDNYAVPQSRLITGAKILRILKKKGISPEIPEDLYYLMKKAVAMRKHIEKNKRDKELQKKFEPSIKNLENKSKALINKCKFLEGRKMNEYIGYINEIELMRKRIRSFRDYAEKINKKTGGDLLIQDPEQEDDGQQDNNDEEEQQEIQGEEGDENENNTDGDNNNDENIEEENNNDMDLENQEMS